LDGLPTLDSGGQIDRLAGFAQRSPLFPGLVRAVIVMVQCVPGQNLPQVSFTVDQQMAGALAPRLAMDLK
jgi:hypothetical protein